MGDTMSFTIRGIHSDVNIIRGESGVPEIICSTQEDADYALGYMHATDRMLHMALTREILGGTASTNIADDDALVELDRFMRSMQWMTDMESEKKKINPQIIKRLEAYCRGINTVLAEKPLPFEFRLLKIKPRPWIIDDVILLTKIFGYLGLVDSQGAMEKFLIQMIQNKVPEDKIKELFPYLTEKIDYDLIAKIKLEPPLVPAALKWMSVIPKFMASNNWAVSGKITSSKKPIMCGDPHLEVNRLPSIWYEIVINLPGNELTGVSIPGAMGMIIGRTSHIAWSPTYTFMDMIDYRIEECSGGKYRRGKKWLPFTVRDEAIVTKKGRVIKFRIYENEHGILEGDPEVDGFYLVRAWSAQKGCGAGDLNGIQSVAEAKSVREAMKMFTMLDAESFNFVIADVNGNIGYQMTGRMFNRPKNVSGLIPMPGWDSAYNPRGFADKTKLPSCYNPSEGIIVTANQDLNYLGRVKPINLPMGTYRADRIRALLEKRKNIDEDYMKTIHYDLYSLQAEKLMKIISPLLPDSREGKILKEWDYVYDEKSSGATAFENVYLALLKRVFGDGGLGVATVEYLMRETAVFNDYYANFDNILMKKSSKWFGNTPKESILISAINEGLSGKIVPYGKTRMITLSHLLFGGKLPSFLGFDGGPISLPGSRATVTQGQIFKTAGRTTTFSPGFRMIADMNKRGILCNMLGGPSDRRFSKYYTSDLKNWISGVYKRLVCSERN